MPNPVLLNRYPGELTPVEERWHTNLANAVNLLLTAVQGGLGSPEGVIYAPQGTIWERQDGAGGTTLYEKTTGGVDPAALTNTGWLPAGSGVAAAAGTLTGTTLAANVVNSSLTGVGTLTSGGTAAGFTVADASLSSNVALKNGTNAFTGANSFATNPLDLLVGQLKFPATQNPSSDANTLDDYEEGGSAGTPGWTPTDTSGAGLVLTVGAAQDLKWGQGVVATAAITFPITANGANVSLGGLPFTSQNTAAGCYGIITGSTTAGLAFTGFVAVNSADVLLWTLAGVAVTNVQMSGKQLRYTALYRAAA